MYRKHPSFEHLKRGKAPEVCSTRECIASNSLSCCRVLPGLPLLSLLPPYRQTGENIPSFIVIMKLYSPWVQVLLLSAFWLETRKLESSLPARWSFTYPHVSGIYPCHSSSNCHQMLKRMNKDTRNEVDMLIRVSQSATYICNYVDRFFPL